jgi:5-methylcytosine-specific restriction protein A
MPTLSTKLAKTYPETPKKHHQKNENLIHQTVYNTKRWRDLRLNYLANHPICECCKKAGRIRAATDVHHVNEISNATTKEGMQRLGFDENNLMAICKECHYQIHNGHEEHLY